MPWRTHSDPRDPAIERRPGVYVVQLNGIAVYVGQSVNVMARLRDLKRRPEYGTLERVWWVDAPKGVPNIHKLIPQTGFAIKIKYTWRCGEHLMLEYRLIRRLRPRFNKKGIRGAQ